MKVICSLAFKKCHPPTFFCVFLIALVLQGCGSMPDNASMKRTYSFENTGNTLLDKIIEQDVLTHPKKSGAILLSDGLDAFVARAALAISAEKSLDIQYYLFHDDTIGGLLVDQLLKAADRGVRVRLLLDDLDLEGKDKNLLILNYHPNISIRVFNPFIRNTGRSKQFVTRLGDVTRRMHNKMFIADNSMVILGGRNIGDDYFDINPDRAFSDLDVLLAGEAVLKTSKAFDLYWNSEVVYPISLLSDQKIDVDDLAKGREALFALTDEQAKSSYAKALQNSTFTQQIKTHQLSFNWLDADIIYDHPIKVRRDRSQREFHMTKKLEPYFRAVEDELLIITPYFVPGKQGLDFLGEFTARGVKVTVITNSLASNDVSAVHSGYARYRKRLLEKGVSLYEIKPKVNIKQKGKKKKLFGSSKTSLHAKSFVLDQKYVFIGSLNLDPRSAFENTEVGTILTSPLIGEGMVNYITNNIDQVAFKVTLKAGELHWSEQKDGVLVEYDVEPYTTWWDRFSVKIMQLLPIESQL
jgi:putative cardiolipin synthase